MLGQECVGSGVSVDLFIFNNSYIDLATIGQVARLTGGEVYKYTYFQVNTSNLSSFLISYDKPSRFFRLILMVID